MSTWTYVSCDKCKTRLWLEKFLGYTSESGSYAFAAKAAVLAEFCKEHSKEGCEVRIFDEHAEKFYSTTPLKGYSEAEDPRFDWSSQQSKMIADSETEG